MKRKIPMKLCMAGSMVVLLSVPVPVRAEIQTGGVRIQLECLEEIETGARIRFGKTPELVPNETLSYIISVKNQGADAWVRLHIDYVKENEDDCGNIPIDDTWIVDIGENWIKKGDCWYCQTPLKKGDTVDFCKAIQIPDINNLSGEMKFRIYSQAEAVQAWNIQPDFTSEDPFAGIFIEDYSSNREVKEEVTGFHISCPEGADTIVDAEGLFADVTELMPGEAKYDAVTIRNANPYAIHVILKEKGKAADDFLAKNIRLTIRKNGKKLYEGPLTDNAIQNGLSLGIYEQHSENRLEFKLELSETAKNNTAFRTLEVEMIFDVEKVEKSYGNPNGENDQNTEGVEDSDTAVRIYPCPDPTVETGYSGGRWKLVDAEKHVWEYYFADGTQAKDGWLYLYNPYSQDNDKNGWFCFNEKGIMQFGWIKAESENWYFCHEISDGNLGRMKKEWHHDRDDQRVYYLDPLTGIMQTGWREIQGNYYYFTPLKETKRQNWFWKMALGRWIYDYLGFRTYGSMFKGERTPDGYLVGEDGVWNGEAVGEGGR